jgi:hypothetical protein
MRFAVCKFVKENTINLDLLMNVLAEGFEIYAKNQDRHKIDDRSFTQSHNGPTG